MAPDTGSAILILVAFVLPGFVTLLLRARLFDLREQGSSFDQLMQALFYSAIVYVCAMSLALILGLGKEFPRDVYEGQQSLLVLVLIGLLVLLVIPAAVAILGARWSTSRLREKVLPLAGGSAAHSIPSGWNKLFSRGESCLVRIHLKNGEIIGGAFWSDKSLAGRSEVDRDIFLERQWEMDREGWFVKRMESSSGVWISSENILYLETYRAKPSEGICGTR